MQSKSRKSAIFGTSPKKCLEIHSKTPGPGRYQVKTSYDGPAFGIRGKDHLVLRQSTPGPGQYCNWFKDEVPSYKFSRSKREVKVVHRSPGPGTYEVKRSSSSKGGLFTRDKKNENKIDSSPGPGYYEVPSQADRKAASMKFRHKVQSEETSPGPARYEARSIQALPANATIGKSKRFSSEKNLIPGPGSYNTSLQDKSFSAIFGSSKKDLFSIKMSELPGPGDYQVKDMIGDGPAFSIVVKRDLQQSLQSPGPGSYLAEENSSVKGWKFGKSKSRDFLKVYNRTGPGDYDVAKIKDHQGWSFSSQSRDLAPAKK
jgi:hypothetical protein